MPAACIKHRSLFSSGLYGAFLERRHSAGIRRNQVPDVENSSSVRQSLFSQSGPSSARSQPRCHLCQEALLDRSMKAKSICHIFSVLPPHVPLCGTCSDLICLLFYCLSLPMRWDSSQGLSPPPSLYPSTESGAWTFSG